MSTTVSMWLGIAFVGLALLATVLQAWLWSFPMVPDPGGPDPNGKSTAPKLWVTTHRIAGFLFLAIYVVLMTEMIPRLWLYQVELPARTVVHACMGIVIGILLAAKIAIIRWFQHFGKALPAIGLAIFTCTILLGTLSIPFAVKAHDFGDAMSPDNLARTERVLATIPFDEKVHVRELANEDAFERGRVVLTTKCTLCHDLRTILQKPRTGQGWFDVVKRMAAKPTIGRRIVPEEIGPVTAYLVAITPDIQESSKQKRKEERKQEERVEQVKSITDGPKAAERSGVKAQVNDEVKAEAKPETQPEAKTGTQPESSSTDAPVDHAVAKKVYEEKCSSCHELKDVDDHGKDSVEGWTKVVTRMVAENGAELSKAEVKAIVVYLMAAKGK